jgi:hypothetical protein
VPYIVDQTVFHAEGAVISWTAAAQRLNIPVWAPLPTVIELRWMLSADLGMPTEPFTVWARQHTAGSTWQPLTISQQQLLFLGLAELVTWSQGSVSSVSVDVRAPSGGCIFASRADRSSRTYARSPRSRPGTQRSSLRRTSSTVSWSRPG